MARRDSLQAQIEDRIARSSDEVFLTREFRSLGGERQVLRALQNTVAAASWCASATVSMAGPNRRG